MFLTAVKRVGFRPNRSLPRRGVPDRRIGAADRYSRDLWKAPRIAGRSAQQGEVNFAVFVHLRMARSQAPRCDACTIESPQQSKKVQICLGKQVDDLIRLKCEVPFEGANAAALEVDPANSLASHDPISIVRFTVKPALLKLGRLKSNKTSLVRRLQELAVCVVQLHHERIVLERLTGLQNHRSERWQISLRPSQRCVESAEGASEHLRCHGNSNRSFQSLPECDDESGARV